jgi:hypothetical protein
MDNGNEIEYKKLVQNDKNQYDYLTSNVRKNYSDEILNWQYLNLNYHSGLFFAYHGNTIISSQGMIPIYLLFQEKILLSAKSESSFLIPDYRGKGHFENLYFYTIEKSKKDNIDCFWGFTIVSKVWKNKLKFNVFDGIIYESILQISSTKSLKIIVNSNESISRKIGKTTRVLFDFFRSKNRIKKSNNLLVKLTDLKNESEKKNLCEVYQKWKTNYPEFVCLNFDLDFLNWRIASNPMNNYRIISLFSDKEIIGYGIINDKNELAYLLDFIVSNPIYINEGLSSLLHYLKQNSKSSHVVFWATRLNNYSSQIHELMLGFGAKLYQNNSMNFVYKNDLEEIEKTGIHNFYLNALWTEGFKI